MKVTPEDLGKEPPKQETADARQLNPSLDNIPKEYFKEAVCACGSNLFSAGSTYLYYPGGLHSKMPVAVAGPAMLICVQCCQPFKGFIGSVATTPEKKAGLMKRLFNGKKK